MINAAKDEKGCIVGIECARSSHRFVARERLVLTTVSYEEGKWTENKQKEGERGRGRTGGSGEAYGG